ncbi:MAG: hypothetical protein H6999_09450 [Hahellaceae bacterium]|nr:hypothetical protein [Hahellaceae bacterium]
MKIAGFSSVVRRRFNMPLGIVFSSLMFGFSVSLPSMASAQEVLEGELDVLHIDFVDGHEETRFYLKETGKKPRRLNHFQANRPNGKPFQSGDKIRVSGNTDDQGVQVETVTVISTTESVQPAQDQAALNARKAVIMMVDMKDVRASDQYTPTQIAGEMFYNSHSVDGVYQASSYNQIGFLDDTNGDGQPDIYGPFSIGYDAAGTCDYYAWAQATEAAASAAGVDLSLYQHRVFVLPRYNNLAQCGWAGIANIGCGLYCRAWVAEAESGMVYAHELGHNLGMGHSSTDPENDGVINSTYGDYSGIMGSNRAWRQMNAPHRVGLGYLNAYTNSLIDVTSGGIYDLYPLETNAATEAVGTQIIRIPTSNSGEYYYVSYRKALGNYGAAAPYVDRISVHRYQGGSIPTALVANLGAGERFEDAVSGLTLIVLQSGGTLAQVQVAYDCVAIAPTLALSPTLQYARSGDVLNYTATLTNNDSAGCASSSFTLGTQSPSGVSAVLSKANLDLAPAANAPFSLQVSGQGADGRYDIAVSAGDSTGAHASASSSVQLILDNQAPSVPTNLSYSVQRKNRIYLSWDVATDALSGVSAYKVYRDGALIYTSSVNLVQDQPGSGTHLYEVVAIDKAGNASNPSSALSVTVGSTGGKTGGGKGKNR